MRPLDVLMRWRRTLENAQYLAELARMTLYLYSEVERIVETLEPLRIGERAWIPWPGGSSSHIVVGRKLKEGSRFFVLPTTPESLFSMIRSAGHAIAKRVRPKIRSAFVQLVELVRRLQEPRIKCLEIINDVVCVVGETLDEMCVMRPPVVLALTINPLAGDRVFMSLRDRNDRAVELWVRNARLALSLCNHLDTAEKLVREADALAKGIVLHNKSILKQMWEVVAPFAVEKALTGR